MAYDDLNDDQLGAVMAGTKQTKSFEIIDVPAGPRELPAWLIDCHVNWMDQYGNRPAIMAKFAYNPAKALTWTNDGSKVWLGTNDEGNCFECHYHNGRVSEQEFERFVRWDTPDGKYAMDCKAIKETYRMLATTKQEGYGGRGFDIQMSEDSPKYPGQLVRLQGPWHGGAPKGFVNLSGITWDEEHRNDKFYNRRRTPWYRRGGCFGYMVTEQTYIDMLATFVPHMKTARVNLGYGIYIEPCRPETGAPKHFLADGTYTGRNP